MKRVRALAAAAAAIAALAACSGDGPTPPSGETGFLTAQPAMATALGAATVTPILSVGDTIPGGVVWAPQPDGLGVFFDGGDLFLFANHELNGVAGSDGQTRFANARVSRLRLNAVTGGVLGGSYVVDGSEGYRSLCSATFTTGNTGLPTGWFLSGEESTAGPKGGIQLAISKAGQVTELPWIGRFQHENLVPVAGFDGRVVLAGLDDTRGASELYLYVAASEAALLAGQGTLYVLASADAANAGQLQPNQAYAARFVALPNAAALTAAQLQAAADAAGALKFVRLEDGDYDRRVTSTGIPALYFVDTGSATTPSTAAPWDPYGSVYRLELDRADPTRGVLRLLARSAGPAAGWASPDNVAANGASLMLQEDPTHPAWARAPRIWRFGLQADGGLSAPQAVVELNNPECGPGGACWESSGIVEAPASFGAGAWLFDVQAHGRPVPSLSLADGAGQLLLLRVPGS